MRIVAAFGRAGRAGQWFALGYLIAHTIDGIMAWEAAQATMRSVRSAARTMRGL